jgi:hypothetical protein
MFESTRDHIMDALGRNECSRAVGGITTAGIVFGRLQVLSGGRENAPKSITDKYRSEGNELYKLRQLVDRSCVIGGGKRSSDSTTDDPAVNRFRLLELDGPRVRRRKRRR